MFDGEQRGARLYSPYVDHFTLAWIKTWFKMSTDNKMSVSETLPKCRMVQSELSHCSSPLKKDKAGGFLNL